MRTRRDLIVALTFLADPSIYAVRKAESEIVKSWGHDYPSDVNGVDLVELAVSWRRFVVGVVRGYGLHSEDYINSVAGRDVLQEIIDRLPCEEAERVRSVITPIDDVFREHTVVVDSVLWEPYKATADDLYRRIPMKLCEPLRTDLRYRLA